MFHSFFIVFIDNKKPQPKLGFLYVIYYITDYSGNAAPVGRTVKSRTMNSAVLVG